MNPGSKPRRPKIDLQWYKDLTEISPVGIFFTDAEGNCLQVNRTWCEIAGIPAEKALGRGWASAIHPEDLERVCSLWYESARNKQPFNAEYRFRTPQGKTTWVIGRATAKLSENGSLQGYIGTITDIEKTRRCLEELQQSSARIQTIIAHMPVILFAFDDQRLLCAWNHEAERLTGYSAEEMVGNPNAIHMLFPDPDLRGEMFDYYKERVGDYRDWDLELRAKDGSVKTVMLSNVAKYYPIAGWSSWGVGVDMTFCRRVEHDLRERIKELTCLYKLSMLTNQPNLNLELFFQEAVELLPGSWQYPEITCARIIFNEGIYKTEPFTVSPWKLSSDLHVRGRKVGAIEVYYSEQRPSASEGPFLLEERLLLDEIALQVSRTISTLLARQDLALLDELRHKSEELENFSHTISHDLKTPLAAIGGFSEFLSNQLAQGNFEQAGLCANKIVENTRRMERRLDEILRLAIIGRIIEPSEEIDLNKIIEETLDMMAKRLEEAHISVQFNSDFPKVVGDSIRLREVIENLLENAIRYIGNKPNQISIGYREQGPDKIFYVRDNGIGIDPQHLKSVFELFRRHVKSIDGEGVGLAITKRIIEAHGGRIWAESEGEGCGASFCFTLGHVIEK